MYAGELGGHVEVARWRARTWIAIDMATADVRDCPGRDPRRVVCAACFRSWRASPADANLVLVSALDSQYIDGRDGIYRTKRRWRELDAGIQVDFHATARRATSCSRRTMRTWSMP